MTPLRFTLVSEGSSDRALVEVIIWAILQHRADLTLSHEWADLGRLRSPPKSLKAKIETALALYPCDLLLVHRDSDREGRKKRVTEIRSALGSTDKPPAVCVVPVRMLEAWFLFDEGSIRRVAGQPKGKTPLALPAMSQVETASDPKALLREAIRTASGKTGRRRRRLNLIKSPVCRIAELIDDFSPLRSLGAFAAFELELRAELDELLK